MRQQMTLIWGGCVSSLFSWTKAAGLARGLGEPGRLAGSCPWLESSAVRRSGLCFFPLRIC